MSQSYLSELASDILIIATEAIDPHRSGNPLPDKRFISWGTPAVDQFDYGQLTVHLAGDQLSAANAVETISHRNCVEILSGRFVVTLYRWVPAISGATDGDNPTPAELSASSEELFADLWAMLTNLTDGVRTIVENCSDVVLGDVSPISPQGGVAGFTVEILVMLNDSGPQGS